MTEIKFRAWDKKEKKMVTQFNLTSDGKSWIYDEDTLNSTCDMSNQYVLMMFTGLRDKNGKEIYEGDIVENKHCIYPNRAECYFEDGSFQFKASGCNQCDDFLANNLTTEFEVIGNVWENPELLKGAK